MHSTEAAGGGEWRVKLPEEYRGPFKVQAAEEGISMEELAKRLIADYLRRQRRIKG